MFRRILGPLKEPAPNALEPAPAPQWKPGAAWRRPGKENLAVDVSEPSDFRLEAHVECDPHTGLYTGIDEFMTHAISPKGRRQPRASIGEGEEDAALPISARNSLVEVKGAPTTMAARARSMVGSRSRSRSRSSSLSRSRRDSLPTSLPGPVVGDAASELAAPALAKDEDEPQPHVEKTVRIGSAPPPPLARPKVSSRRPPRGAGPTPLPLVSGSPSSKSLSPRGGSSSTVSKPFKTRHEVHVRLDPHNPTGFAGLPGAWETILMYSGILRDEAMANPEAVIDVLNFSKTSDPSATTVAAKRSSLVNALPPIRFTRPQTPSITSFDTSGDGFRSSSDGSAGSSQGLLNVSAADTAAAISAPDPAAPFNLTHLVHSDSQRRRRARSAHRLGLFASSAGSNNALPAADLPPATAAVLSSVNSDEMEKMIGAERLSDLPDGIPEDLTVDFRVDDPDRLFSRIEQIGEGSCGAVYRAVDADGRFVALKKVTPTNDRDWKLYMFEVHVMQDQYDSENLVDCYDAFRNGPDLWIVMEYISAGTLADLLSQRRIDVYTRSKTANLGRSTSISSVEDTMSAKEGPGLGESLIAYICREVLLGLNSLHSIQRVHRDIKGDNTLMDMDGSVKVADFGFCAQLSKGTGKRNTVVGTPFWMAPEVIRGSNYDCKVDIWSTGVLALECAEGKPPHLDAPPIRAMFLIATQGAPGLSNPQLWSKEIQEFIAHCCAIDPTKRPSAARALAHPFIAKACSQAEAARVFSEVSASRRSRMRRSGTGANCWANYRYSADG